MPKLSDYRITTNRNTGLPAKRALSSKKMVRVAPKKSFKNTRNCRQERPPSDGTIPKRVLSDDECAARRHNHSACTKIFPQNKQRFTASKSSSTTQLFWACLGNQFVLSGSDDLLDSGRIAFLLQPTHLRIILVDRINEVIEHRPEVGDGGVQVNQVQYLHRDQTE